MSIVPSSVQSCDVVCVWLGVMANDSRAVWFKVQEEGRSGTSNTWGATALMTSGGSVTYTVPKCIPAGYYLVRHEIVALHSAYSYPGAQFYPVSSRRDLDVRVGY